MGTSLRHARALIYGIVFGLTSVLMAPCLPLTIVAGCTFAMWNGLIDMTCGIAIRAAAGFLVARYAARGADFHGGEGAVG